MFYGLPRGEESLRPSPGPISISTWERKEALNAYREVLLYCVGRRHNLLNKPRTPYSPRRHAVKCSLPNVDIVPSQ